MCIGGGDGSEEAGSVLPGAGGELAGAGAGVGAGEGGDAAEVAGGAHGAPALEVAVADVGADGHLVAVAVARPALRGLGAVGALAAGVVDRLLQHRVGGARLAHAERRICAQTEEQLTSNLTLAMGAKDLYTTGCSWASELCGYAWIPTIFMRIQLAQEQVLLGKY